MTLAAERALIADAVRRAAAAAELPWPPTGSGPVPLYEMIAAFNLDHAELPALTRASAAAHLRSIGVERADLLTDPTPLAGFLFANDAGGCVLVRRDDPIPRRRFSAAHELGHYLLHFRATDAAEGFVKDDEMITDADDEVQLATMERQANAFAAELLMPAEVCLRLAGNRQASRRYLEHRLAGELLVSREAARWRLRSI